MTNLLILYVYFIVEPEQYCLCNQPEFGLMVACDNVECKIQWFHLACVGLKAAPKGSWICPQCISPDHSLNNKMHGLETR